MRLIFLVLIILSLACSSRFTYEDAEKRGTIDAYYRFIIENPDSSESEQALSKIKDMLFTQAFQKRDVILIKQFLTEFPLDKRAQTLRDLLDEIRFEEAKKKNNKSALEIFIRKTENRKLKEEAENLLEEIDYKEVKDSKDIRQIETFIQKYPKSPHYIELNERLMKSLYERILGGDVFFAEEFVSRFPESGKVDEINRLLIENLLKQIIDLCILDGYDRIQNIYNKTNKNFETLLNLLKDSEKKCSSYYNLFAKIASKKISQIEVKKIFSKKTTEKERTVILNLFQNYLDALSYLKTMADSLQSEDPEKRRLSYLYIKSFPLSLKIASDLTERFINSTLFERYEISQIMRSLVTEEQNRKVFNLIFFINRNKPLYVIMRNFFLRNSGDFEKENTFLNKAFSDAKEDVLLQHLIIEMAYENGFNAFIRSVADEHIKQIFSLTSEFQSLCQEGCSKRLLFEIKGVQLILKKDSEIFRTALGEKSEVLEVLTEKEREISAILDKYKFAPEMPIIKNPSEGIDIEILKTVIEKPILTFLYQAEPDTAKREKIKNLINK